MQYQQISNQYQKTRPYKYLLFLPNTEPVNPNWGWSREYQTLRQFILEMHRNLNIDKNPQMIPVLILKARNFIKENLPLYSQRLKPSSDTNELVRSYLSKL